MDHRGYKDAAPGCVRWPITGKLFWFKPLSQTEIDRAGLEAERVVNVLGAGGDSLFVERCSRIVALSLGVELDELVNSISVTELIFLFNSWIDVQRQSQPQDQRQFNQWIRKRVNDNPGVMFDGLIAYMIEHPTRFYGRPATELTDGQVIYFMAVKNAYNDFFVPDQKGNLKQASKRWLESDE